MYTYLYKTYLKLNLKPLGLGNERRYKVQAILNIYGGIGGFDCRVFLVKGDIWSCYLISCE